MSNLCLTYMQILGLSIIVAVVIAFGVILFCLTKKRKKGVLDLTSETVEKTESAIVGDKNAQKVEVVECEQVCLLAKRTYTVGAGNKVKPAKYKIICDENCEMKINEVNGEHKNGDVVELVDKDTVSCPSSSVTMEKIC